MMRFNYPDTQSKLRAAKQRKQEKALATLQTAGGMDVFKNNFAYWGRGDRELAPTEAYDNGRFTYLKFNNGRALPAFYRVENDGSETLLNTHIDGDTVVIHETAQHFILRLGRDVLELENRAYNPQGQFNHTGTDDGESVRLIKGQGA